MSLTDYSSRETKLRSIYNYIECIIYGINRKKWQKNENCFNKCLFYLQRKFTYKFWEVINLIAFAVLNALLMAFYYKSRDETDLIYNQIDNRKSFLLTDIWPLIHIFILLLFLVYWLFSRAKLEYFFSMTKYMNGYFKENEKLSMDVKAKLLNKEEKYFCINSFFPKKIEEEIKGSFEDKNCCEIVSDKVSYVFTNYIKVLFYSLKSVYPFILSLLCLCLSFWSQIFLILPLFLFFNLFETLSSIFFY